MSSQLILASASAARARLLRGAGLSIETMPSSVDEASIKAQFTGGGDELARMLAAAKAEQVSHAHPAASVIGADQILECDGTLFDKPADRAGAVRHLLRLRGRTHRLITACAVHRAGAMCWSHVSDARLTMRSFSDTFLEDYLNRAGDDVTASVGAYRLEDLGAQLFDKVEGDYFTILGLPLIELLSFLRGEGEIAA